MMTQTQLAQAHELIGSTDSPAEGTVREEQAEATVFARIKEAFEGRRRIRPGRTGCGSLRGS
jgi:hypothetical protein